MRIAIIVTCLFSLFVQVVSCADAIKVPSAVAIYGDSDDLRQMVDSISEEIDLAGLHKKIGGMTRVNISMATGTITVSAQMLNKRSDGDIILLDQRYAASAEMTFKFKKQADATKDRNALIEFFYGYQKVIAVAK